MRTSAALEPDLRGRPRAAASSAGSRRPLHATSTPPSASSGAAYSTSTGSAAIARAVTTSCARRRPATPPRARATTTVFASAPRRSRARWNAHLRAALSTSATRAPVARPQAPGRGSRGPSRGRRSGSPRGPVELQRDERVGQVGVRRRSIRRTDVGAAGSSASAASSAASRRRPGGSPQRTTSGSTSAAGPARASIGRCSRVAESMSVRRSAYASSPRERLPARQRGPRPPARASTGSSGGCRGGRARRACCAGSARPASGTAPRGARACGVSLRLLAVAAEAALPQRSVGATGATTRCRSGSSPSL